jgi:hypothetical protein
MSAIPKVVFARAEPTYVSLPTFVLPKREEPTYVTPAREQLDRALAVARGAAGRSRRAALAEEELREWEASLDGPDPRVVVLSEEWDLVAHERACKAYFRSEGREAPTPGTKSAQEYVPAENFVHYVLRDDRGDELARYRVHIEGDPQTPREIRLERVREEPKDER